MSLPGVEVRLGEGTPVAIVRDPASWLAWARAHPDAVPGTDAERLERWREHVQAVLASSESVVLYHRAERLLRDRAAVVISGDGSAEAIDPALLIGCVDAWQTAVARAIEPVLSRPAPARRWSEGELARRLWAQGWSRWFEAHPGWSLGRPVVGTRRLTYPVHGGAAPFALVVEPAVEAVGPMYRGTNLAVRVQGEGWAVQEVDDLGRIAMVLDRKGLAFEADGASGRVELFIASACNLQCYFCMESERISHRSFMPWEQIQARIRGYAARGMRMVQFMGGEATIHPRFADALRLCRELGLQTYVITNLLRWSDRAFADEVAELLDEVMVSLHAYGDQAGIRVTGQRTWWGRFQTAHRNFRETSKARRIRASTVFSRASEPDLERIAELLLELGPERWIMGNAVPIEGTRLSALDEGFRLAELRAWQPRFKALKARCAEAGCRLVFFCFPHCVLGPELWDDSHDQVVDNQDLSEGADGATSSVNFWSRADYDETPRPVTLGRVRPEVCGTCARKQVCGGAFTDYLAQHGSQELHPVGSFLALAIPGEESDR